jgi:ubiquinone/menaquinone biosynthesis C-methylase UbiE
MGWWAERTIYKWRRMLWGRIGAGHVLEVGVGTGKNLPYRPPEARYVGIDLSPRMLANAMRREGNSNPDASLALMDAQALAFADSSFDRVVATFVFCSVPNPEAGLRELGRVSKRDGLILLLEHVRSENPVLGRLMDVLNPLMVRITGANINRDTVGNVRKAGLEIVSVEDVGMHGIVKLITARPHMVVA